MTSANLKLLFPTPLWEADIGDETLNNHLRETIFSIEKSDDKFNADRYPFGYTSYASDINLAQDARFQEITRRVLQEAKKFLVAMQMQTQAKVLKDLVPSLQVYDLFCNINRKYSAHGPHRHECVDLSAVYYVDVGEDPANFIAHSPTEPLLMHTRSQFFADKSPMAQEKQSFRPETGKLLMFPSWMMHEVQQQKTDSERVSLAFNLGIVTRPKKNAQVAQI